MPYLSHNYRFQQPSKVRLAAESGVFITIAAMAIFFALFIFGWISATASQAADTSTQHNQSTVTNET